MPNIVITEIDQTTPGVNAESFEVAYIPGCVDINQKSLYDTEGKYVGLELNKPTLFTSVSDFEALCGTQGLTFEEDVDYRTLITESSTGFSSNAVPFDNIMFKQGTIDPAYVMAKELLSAGLNVLYERINDDYKLKAIRAEVADGKVTKPENWEINYKNYFVNMTQVKKISDATAPRLGKAGDRVFEMLVVDTSKTPQSGTTYYIQKKDANGNFLDTYDTEASVTTFNPNIVYYTQGRTFYKLEGTDNGIDLSWALDVSGDLVETLKIYQLSEVPSDWSTSYWKEYYECVDEIIEVPTYKSSTEPVVESAPPYQFVEAKVMSMYESVQGIDIESVYTALEGIYDSDSEDGLADKGNYSIKYLTSGGYPVYEYNSNSIVNRMISLAEKRGDCVAIVDHTDNQFREANVALTGSLYKTVNDDITFQTGGEYATMFTPWATYLRTTTDKDSEGLAVKSSSFRMPASFAYLMSLADSIQTNAAWLAVAGASRGVVGNLAPGGMTTDIPNGAADKMQPRQGIAVNAITNIKPYGYTIWGNRTLKKNAENLTATSFLNIRNLVSDVKKTCYRAARGLTFEQNTEVLWVNFKSKIAPTLDRMLSGYGISGYKIIRDTQHEKAAEKATICAKVILYPVYAVEDFYITIVLKDDEITVESAE